MIAKLSCCRSALSVGRDVGSVLKLMPSDWVDVQWDGSVKRVGVVVGEVVGEVPGTFVGGASERFRLWYRDAVSMLSFLV